MMQDISTLREQLLLMAYAPNTNKTYLSVKTMYLKFMEEFSGWELWSDESVAAWMLDAMINRDLKKSTLKTRMSGIEHHIKVVERLPFDKTSPGSVLFLVARAIGRMGDDATPKQPIKVGMLHDVLHRLRGSWDEQLREALLAICPNLYDITILYELVMWYCVSFACFLRSEEMAGLTWEQVQLGELENEQLQKFPKQAAIKLETSRHFVYKTMTTSVQIVMDRASNEGVCPVKAIAQLVVNRKGHLKGAIFRVSADQARKVLQVLAAHVSGKEPKSFGLHSLRSGAACTADESGVNMAKIMFMGRWRSAAVLAYLRGDADGASALLLRGHRPGQGTRRGEVRVGLTL